MSKAKRRQVKTKKEKRLRTFCKGCGERRKLTKMGLCVSCTTRNSGFTLMAIPMLAGIKARQK